MHINEHPPRPAAATAVRCDARGRDRRWSAAVCAATVTMMWYGGSIGGSVCDLVRYGGGACSGACDRGWRRGWTLDCCVMCTLLCCFSRKQWMPVRSAFHNKMSPARVWSRSARSRTRKFIIIYFPPVSTCEMRVPAGIRRVPGPLQDSDLRIGFTMTPHIAYE